MLERVFMRYGASMLAWGTKISIQILDFQGFYSAFRAPALTRWALHYGFVVDPDLFSKAEPRPSACHKHGQVRRQCPALDARARLDHEKRNSFVVESL